MEKYKSISGIITALIVFIILNIWFITDNNPHWILATIISIIVFLVSYPGFKLSKFIINIGDKINNKILRVLYYIFFLPFITISFTILIALFCGLIVNLFNYEDLGTGIIIAFIGLGILTCTIIPYVQTLTILLLRKKF